jgi:hypothetical protein
MVPGHGVVVHVGDDDRPRLAGAGRVIGSDAAYLKHRGKQKMSTY